MQHHYEVTVKTRAVIYVHKCCSIPRLRHAEFQNVRGEHRGIAFILPQVIRAQISEDEQAPNGSDHC